METHEPKPSQWWPLITIGSAVFVLPVLILIWAIGSIEGSIDVAVRNDCRETIRDVRIVINGRAFELGTLEPSDVLPVDEEFESSVSMQVSAKIGPTAAPTQSETFSRDPTFGEATSLLLVLDAQQRWLLRRR